MGVIDIGLEQFIVRGYIFLLPDNSEAKRKRKEAAEKGVLINANAGRKTRSLIITPVNQVILSPLTLKTHRARIGKSVRKGGETIGPIEGGTET